MSFSTAEVSHEKPLVLPDRPLTDHLSSEEKAQVGVRSLQQKIQRQFLLGDAMLTLQEHITRKLQDSHKFQDPFPYFFAQNVFPDDFYAEIQQILSQKTDFHTESFQNRTFADQIGVPALDFMKSHDFLVDMLQLFRPQAVAAFGGVKTAFTRDCRLIRDGIGYKIGPHTDAAWKVLSLLFYLPPTDEYRDYGTSIFTPDDSTATCEGGPHYGFDGFTEVWRAPFVPNSCLGFWKTNKSFHGVYPIPVQFPRDVLLYNIYRARD